MSIPFADYGLHKTGFPNPNVSVIARSYRRRGDPDGNIQIDEKGLDCFAAACNDDGRSVL